MESTEVFEKVRIEQLDLVAMLIETIASALFRFFEHATSLVKVST